MLTGFLWAVPRRCLRPTPFSPLSRAVRSAGDRLRHDRRSHLDLVLSIAAHYPSVFCATGARRRATALRARSRSRSGVSRVGAVRALDVAAPIVFAGGRGRGRGASTWASTMRADTVSSALAGSGWTILARGELSAGLLARAAPSNAGAIVLARPPRHRVGCLAGGGATARAGAITLAFGARRGFARSLHRSQTRTHGRIARALRGIPLTTPSPRSGVTIRRRC